MKNSTHIFVCSLITLTGGIIDFIAGITMGGWALIIVTAIEVVLGLLTLKNEKKQEIKQNKRKQKLCNSIYQSI